MARTARKHSDSGVYHVILRGVNKQQIFECTEDYQRFLNILRTLTVREQDESGHRSKYGRIGHLFQERFKSQPVGYWGYFREYKWSSWLEYIGQEKNAFCAIDWNCICSSVFSIECSRVVRPANSVENPWHGCQSSGIQQVEPVDVQAYRCWAIQCLWTTW